MKIQCAIFDFDGTLFDSMQMWNTAADEYLRSIGREPAPGLRDAVKAMSLRRAAEYLQKEYALTRTVEEILAGIDGIVERFYMQEAQPKPGVPEFLREMQRAGIAMCIATATSRYLIEAALKRCGLERFFDAIFTCGEVGHGKERACDLSRGDGLFPRRAREYRRLRRRDSRRDDRETGRVQNRRRL